MGDIAVGTRIAVGDDLAVVKFVGVVPPTEGEWLGVEWDDPARGKHDGSRDGVSYFKCGHPTSGSFIRRNKANFGISFVDAVQTKYSEFEMPAPTDLVDSRNQRVPIELVGANRMLRRLKSADLSSCHVSSAGDGAAIQALLPELEQLHLSRNLLADWREIAAITRHLPALTTLHLSENVLLSPRGPELEGAFPRLATLVLNSTKLAWAQIAILGPHCPALEELHACANNIDSLEADLHGFPRLHHLNLSKNSVADWAQLRHLQPLAALRTLALNDNRLGDGLASAAVVPAQLTSLYINNNAVSQWHSIDVLGQLSLRELRIRENPVLDTERALYARQLLVARLPTVTLLNGSTVTPREREQSALYYLSRFAEDYHAALGDDARMHAFTAQHPRFEEFCKQYGAPPAPPPPVVTLKDHLLTLTIAVADRPLFELKVPPTTTVAQLRKLVTVKAKLARAGASATLSCKDRTGCVVPLDDDLRDLDFFSVANGDTIVVGLAA